MKKALVLVDFQNDFIDGSLGTKEAQAILPNVIEKLSHYPKENRFATQDTHFEDYLSTQEGKNLPVIHCQNGTYGWEIRKEAQVGFAKIFEKTTFGSLELGNYLKDKNYQNITLVGVVSNICVLSNAVIVKSALPETPIFIDVKGISSNDLTMQAKAISILENLQFNIINK